MAFELIKVPELPELTTPSDPNVIPIQDGDYLKRISFEDLKEAITGDVADDLAAEVTASSFSNVVSSRYWLFWLSLPLSSLRHDVKPIIDTRPINMAQMKCFVVFIVFVVIIFRYS